MQAKNQIGIGIITKNRRETFYITYANIKKYAPEGCKIVIVDDGSDIPLPEADIRHEVSKGIAGASNAVFSLLDDCEHIFLYNDDCYPIVNDWWVPYVKSGYNHLNLSFELNAKGERLAHSVYVIEKKDDVWVYGACNGCMMYIRNIVLQTVGGMDPNYYIWGLEHAGYTKRIHNAGLTPYEAMDVPNAIKMFYSYDYYGNIKSSVPETTRVDCIRKNAKLFKATKHSKEYIPYK